MTRRGMTVAGIGLAISLPFAAAAFAQNANLTQAEMAEALTSVPVALRGGEQGLPIPGTAPVRPQPKRIYRTISTGTPAPAPASAPGMADTPRPAGLFPSGCPAGGGGSRPVLPLPGITFKFGLAQLEPKAISVVRNLGKTLSENLPNATFTIEGHTDSSGSFAYNQELSLRRAEAVKAYLVGMGVKAERLEAAGAGYCGLANTDDPAGGENRRVVVINTSG